jgi:predicted patatin/cPLA2 family phospholipase
MRAAPFQAHAFRFLWEEFCIDGGISDPLPVDVLQEMGIERIIAVNTIPRLITFAPAWKSNANETLGTAGVTVHSSIGLTRI